MIEKCLNIFKKKCISGVLCQYAIFFLKKIYFQDKNYKKIDNAT